MKKSLLNVFSLVFVLLLAACGNSGEGSQSATFSSEQTSVSSTREDVSSIQSSILDSSSLPKETFTVTWLNYDGTVLEIDESVSEGVVPSYNGVAPIRADDSSNTYTWSGWAPELKPVTGNQTYTATFSQEKIKYTVNFDLNGGSSLSYTGFKTIESFTKDIFFFDCVKDGWNFRGWSYNGTKVFDEKGKQLVNPTMAKSMTFVAMYAQTAKLTIFSSIDGAGTITGEGEYPYNTNVDVSAYAKHGYVFVGWYYENTLLSNTNDYKYMMWSDDVSLEARFKYDSYKMSIYTNNDDYGLVLLKSTLNNQYLASYEENREYSSIVTVAAYSKTDTRFLGWYDTDNKLVETNAVYSFVMPFFDYELEAKWDFFTIEYELDGGLNNSLNPTNYTIESTNLNLYAPTRQGYDFAGWEYKGSIVSSVNPNWASNIVLTAMWRASRNLLTVNSKDSSKGTVSIVSGSGYSGESIIVEATPAGGYVFNGWYQGTSLVSKQTRYTFTMPTSDYSLSARFLTQAEEVKERNKALGITPVIDAVNNTVTYGLYPQKNINDSTLLTSLNAIKTPESNGWYLFNNEYYAKLSATPYDSNYVFDNGTTIASGTTYWFKCEPITWNIINNNNGDYYLLSSVLLDAHRYAASSNNYKNSQIRSWLNNEFYNSAFALGANCIKTTNVDNSAATTDSNSNQYACEDTQDKVFLPSQKDYLNANYGFSSIKSRECKTTDWARARGAFYYTSSDYLYNGWYWTRSPYGFNSKYACLVDSDGYLNYYNVSYDRGSVRPSLSLSIAE